VLAPHPLWICGVGANLDRLPPKNEKGFSTLCQKASKLVNQDVLYFVCLFDLDANADAVDTRLDKDTLILVASNCQGGQQNLRRGARFNLGDIVSFRCLGSKV